MGNVDDWQPRLDQGKELLYKRALVGYRGEKGSMPSRGSNAKLSEAEVKAAVDYIYEYAAPAWSTGK
jgi:cytochrome c5